MEPCSYTLDLSALTNPVELPQDRLVPQTLHFRCNMTKAEAENDVVEVIMLRLQKSLYCKHCSRQVCQFCADLQTHCRRSKMMTSLTLTARTILQT